MLSSKGLDFKKDVSNWIHASTEDEFTAEFDKFRKKYTSSSKYPSSIQEVLNNYINYLFEKRMHIAKCFTKNYFSACASSTQRCESMNAVVKRHLKIARRTTFVKLVDCLKYLNDSELYEINKEQLKMNTKESTYNDILLQSLEDNFSAFIVKKILNQFEK